MPSDVASEDEYIGGLPHDASQYVDVGTFSQILEMDEDEDEREFTRPLVSEFFKQARKTFAQMDVALKEEDLGKLQQLGHYLKGSSATLGLNRVKDSCEKIQHLGEKKNEKGDAAEDADVCLKKIKDIMPVMKEDYRECADWLRDFFGPPPITDSDEED